MHDPTRADAAALPPLDEHTADPDPFRLFRDWFEEAGRTGPADPTAMTLATADADGRPSARMVLLKGWDERGFVFFTNYNSRKGRDLSENPLAALLFWWPMLERQVRIEGVAEPLSPEESDAYFNTRPLGAQLGAWASPQSELIAGRAVLDARLEDVKRRFADQPVARPAHWGGYRVVPDTVEFWQSRPDRLHDRLRYRRNDHKMWVCERLAP
jgi:pyridoxamine 5'-phosphate oxidase